LQACMDYLDEMYTYTYILGMSGAAFRLMWNSKKWDGGNVDIVFMAEDWEEPFRRAFQALGYHYKTLERGESDRTAFRDAIIESISEQAHPVLAFGVMGPPEICIVTGYDDDGDTLIGWNFFQEDPEAFPEQTFEDNGMFRKSNWRADTPGLILIAEKRSRPPQKTLDRKALAWALDVVRTPQVGEYYGGLRAYEAWAEWMQRDADFPDDLAVLAERKMVHYDAMAMVSERARAADFLRSMADRHRAVAGPLRAALACYEKEHELLEPMHEATQGFMAEPEEARRLIDADARAKIAELVLQARKLDAEAADHIERALHVIKRS
ncbi:MAG: hypothetical protein ACP5JG_01660, partial [Anaerolineae bacterium]